ncbi:MAG: class I SAM-dependent methyltransferase [Paramuribaculum sp.]|nr:class I SAM-dependent methyltransferase [Paramuribaculum sp.]
MTDQLRDWIKAHANDDPLKLRLKYGGDSEKEFAILQIECRRKAASKLSDTLRCEAFEFPTALSAEQCTSDMLAGYHARLIEDGVRVLDMTFGLGIDAFHLARKASVVDGVEISPEVAEAGQHNAAALGADNVKVICGDSMEVLGSLAPDSYDVIFIDPARRGDAGQRLYALSDCRPDVTALLPRMLEVAPKVIVKASPMIDLSQCMRELPGCSNIYCIGTRAECKEVVAVVERGYTGESVITAVTMSRDDVSEFSFRAGEEFPKPQCEGAVAGQFLYEPWPAVMKSGGMSAIAAAFPSLRKLHPNTHLFVSRERIEGFPGDRFVIDRVNPYASHVIKDYARRKEAAEFGIRNFPIAAQTVVKRLGLIQKGPRRLFAVTSVNGPELILCSPDNC